MGDEGTLTVFAGSYEEIADAMNDFAEMQSLHTEKQIGGYDAALVTKEPGGHIVISNVDSSKRFKGGAAGAVAGGILGAIFPPSIMGMAAVGAGAGVASANVEKHLKRSDFKQLGDLLRGGRSGIIVVTDEVTERGADGLLRRALRKMRSEVEADTEAIKNAVAEAVMLDRVPRV